MLIVKTFKTAVEMQKFVKERSAQQIISIYYDVANSEHVLVYVGSQTSTSELLSEVAVASDPLVSG